MPLRLAVSGGGHMQRAGADVVDAAARQLVDKLHQTFGLGGQADDGVLAEQRASFLRFHIGLADMHAIHRFDALVARLPYHIHVRSSITKRHGIGLCVVLDDLRDVAGHFGDILRIRRSWRASWMNVAPPRNASSTTSVTGRPLQSCGPTTKYALISKQSRIEANG